MIDVTNVTPLRRRADAEAAHTSAAPTTPVPLPLDEPFADALLANARAKRLNAVNATLAKRTEERLQAEQLKRNQLNEAHRAGMDIGLMKGFTRGWYWGLGTGVVVAGSLTYLCIKAGQIAGQL